MVGEGDAVFFPAPTFSCPIRCFRVCSNVKFLVMAEHRYSIANGCNNLHFCRNCWYELRLWLEFLVILTDPNCSLLPFCACYGVIRLNKIEWMWYSKISLTFCTVFSLGLFHFFTETFRCSYFHDSSYFHAIISYNYKFNHLLQVLHAYSLQKTSENDPLKLSAHRAHGWKTPDYER